MPMSYSGYLLGFDVGSSSVKATLLDSETGRVAASAQSPDAEMRIDADHPGWAEQPPDRWWDHVLRATDKLKERSNADLGDVQAVGISYQMHGLVLVDSSGHALRPSIIWCDSRAVETGNRAFSGIGAEKCLKHLLNSPGNFTASKLKWVMDNEPDVYRRIHKFMLPGDYIAMKLTGLMTTTIPGLSEGILWDYVEGKVANLLLDHYAIDPGLVADIVPTFGVQGETTRDAARALGIKPGTPVAYRSGDQPNNAFSMNVLNPGELAATAGTSGVVYGVVDRPVHDSKSRVNTFVHVNHDPAQPRYGVLLCINGTGILNSWLKHQVMSGGDRQADYPAMNELAASVPVGAEGVVILPFGNGAERTLENRDLGASIYGLAFNAHTAAHVLRAAQEGIVFALNYGNEILRDMGVEVDTVRAGHSNMFLSPLFAEAFATVTGAVVELFSTDGSQGAARGAGLGAGLYASADEAFIGLEKVHSIEPDRALEGAYADAYEAWKSALQRALNDSEERSPAL